MQILLSVMLIFGVIILIPLIFSTLFLHSWKGIKIPKDDEINGYDFSWICFRAFCLIIGVCYILSIVLLFIHFIK